MYVFNADTLSNSSQPGHFQFSTFGNWHSVYVQFF